MSVRDAILADRERWDELVLSSPYGSFLQMWEWGEFQTLFGTSVRRFILEDESLIHGVVQVVIRELPFYLRWYSVSRGPVLAERIQQRDIHSSLSIFLDSLEKTAHTDQAVFLRIEPPFYPGSREGSLCADIASARGWLRAKQMLQSQHTSVLDITRSDDELLATMHEKTRYNIRLAERKGVVVRFSQDEQDIEIFLKLARSVSERTSFHFHPDLYYKTLMAHLRGTKLLKGELAIAEHDGQPLAVHLMIYAGLHATYLHGASAVEKRNFMAPQLLYWKTVARAKESGCATYDFYGIAPPDATIDHPWAGITRIKKGFGGRDVSYMNSYEYSIRPMFHQLYRMYKGRKGYFGSIVNS